MVAPLDERIQANADFPTKGLIHPPMKKHSGLIFFVLGLIFLVDQSMFSDSSTQSVAESSGNHLKTSVLDTKRAKFDKKSSFGYVRTYC